MKLYRNLFRDWYVSTFIKCTKCGGKLDLRHEGAFRLRPPFVYGWYHPNCSVIRDEACLEMDKRLADISRRAEEMSK